MKKTDLISTIAENKEMTQSNVESIVNAVFEEITLAMAAGETVSIAGFGNFVPKLREERQGRNPKTGEAITIPKAIAPTFKAGKALKDAIQQQEALA